MTLSSDISTTSTSLSDIKNAIIAKGVTPTGNITTYAAAIANIPTGDIGKTREVKNGVYQMPTSSFTFSLPSDATDVGNYGLYYCFFKGTGITNADLSYLTSISGNSALHYIFYQNTGITNVDLSSLTTISGTNGLNYAFHSCTSLTSVNLSSLTTVSGTSAMSAAFRGCTDLTSISFPSLTTVSGTSAMTSFLYGCTGLTSISFPSLTTLSGSQCLQDAFVYCKNLTSISFPALKTTSFGSTYKNQFNSMMYGTGSTTTHTIHFPSNLQSTISGLTGYPLFGGTSGYVVLAFDLPATS